MINTLKDLETINGKGILQERIYHGDNKTIDWVATDKAREEKPIFIDHDVDMISFKMLTKPASEGGNLNLCQWSDLVTTGLEQLKYLNNKFPCKENAVAITHIETALLWNDKRTADRVKRNVEGKNEK